MKQPSFFFLIFFLLRGNEQGALQAYINSHQWFLNLMFYVYIFERILSYYKIKPPKLGKYIVETINPDFLIFFNNYINYD